MAKLEGHVFVTDGDQFTLETDSTPRHELGTEFRVADSRVFRYGKVGAAAISKGKLQLSPTPIANHANIACAAAAAGSTQVTVTPGATGGAADIYAEGYLCINDVDGEGQTYKIKGHAAITASTAFVVDLFDPIKTALTANSEATLVHNRYNGVVEGTSATDRPAGVPNISMAIGDFGWFQVSGPAAVLCGTTRTAAAWQMASGATAGAVVDHTDVTAPQTQFLVGRALIAGVDTEYNPVQLNID